MLWCWRNCWMLQRADYVVTYITHPWGGAAQYSQKAKRAGKTVIHVSPGETQKQGVMIRTYKQRKG